MNTRDILEHLRQLRVSQRRHADLASEYLYRAGKGVSPQTALNIGGTGNCPLTNYADTYDTEHRLALQAKRDADAIWATVTPLLEGLEFDARRVIELYYNQGVPREDIPAMVKRSAVACDRMNRETVIAMAEVKNG